MDLAGLYRQMLRARVYELAVAELWQQGLVSGEMHLATGEEAIAAGVVTHLQSDDALSLTHRCSAALVVRGVPLVPMLRELLGRSDGLCGGRGGHMHLFSRAHLAATSGIVGASLPLGAGFALAARRLRAGSVAVAFAGSGAMDQGMALEALNLAATWSLPLVVVCVDNGWAITTPSGSVTAGDLVERAAAFAITAMRVNGADVEEVHEAADGALARARAGRGPSFLYATCPRLDGHFLGDPLMLAARAPLTEGRATLGNVMSALLTPGGGSVGARAESLHRLASVMSRARHVPSRDSSGDPLVITRRKLRARDAAPIEREVNEEIAAAVAEARAAEGGARA